MIKLLQFLPLGSPQSDEKVDDKNKYKQKKHRRNRRPMLLVPGAVEGVGGGVVVGYKCPLVQSLVSTFVNKDDVGRISA